jgi:hypothetical protein
MNELKIGGNYLAKRNGTIAVKQSEQGALMVNVPYIIHDSEIVGIQSICIGTKDGTLQEKAINNLRDIFKGWTSANPFDLQRLPENESGEAEFELKDWHNEPYTNRAGNTIDKHVFRWMNPISRANLPASETEEAEVLAKWGKKFEYILKPVAPTVNPEPAPVAPKKVAKVTQKPAKVEVARQSSPEEVMDLLCKKYNIAATDEAGQQKLGDDYYFPANDALFGVGNLAETPEQWGQVANHLGL